MKSIAFTFILMLACSIGTAQYLAPDATFGTDGYAFFADGSSTQTDVLTLQPDGKILTGGFINNWSQVNNFCVTRLNNDGTLDMNFGSGGKIFLSLNNSQNDIYKKASTGLRCNRMAKS